MEISGIYDSRIIKEKDGGNPSHTKRPLSEEAQIYKVDRGEGNLYTGANDGIRVRLGASLEEIQRLYIQETLRRFGGDMDKAARSLNIKRGILTKKMNRLGLNEMERG
jgi:DNA-binding NtrC family response regulator